MQGKIGWRHAETSAETGEPLLVRPEKIEENVNNTGKILEFRLAALRDSYGSPLETLYKVVDSS